jgi:hypothetical protein
MSKYLFLCFFLVQLVLLPTSCWAQQESLSLQDSVNRGMKYLLEDRRTRFETTDAINALYNSNFTKADLEFRFLEVKYPEHPLPIFLQGLAVWWRILPNEDDEQYDARFLELMDRTIDKSEKLWDRKEGNLEAAFFLAGAHGFRGRLHADRKNWRKATFDGKKALDWLKKSREQETFSPEFLFGDGLFNYYREYISENFKVLRPVLTFFPRGSKTKGIEQLENVARFAFYTRTEAQTYLMRIYANEEGTPAKALPIASYLTTTFPDNAFFARNFARLSYSTGRMNDCKTASLNIYNGYKAAKPGYEDNSFRYATYFLGYITRQEAGDTTARRQAIHYFEEAILAGERAKQVNNGYTLYSMLYAGELYHGLGQTPTARALMKRVVSEAEKGHAAAKEAEQWLDKNPDPSKKDKWWKIF